MSIVGFTNALTLCMLVLGNCMSVIPGSDIITTNTDQACPIMRRLLSMLIEYGVKLRRPLTEIDSLLSAWCLRRRLTGMDMLGNGSSGKLSDDPFVLWRTR